VADDILNRTPITRSQLAAQLRALGLRAGSVVEVHCGLRSLGFVVGGSDAVVLALLDAVGADGTLLALTGWEHDSFDLERWPEPVRRAYLDDPPIFDPAVSEAARDMGRLAERIRTWPGAMRSNHPEASFAAMGPRAGWLIEDQPWDHPYGRGSPLAKLVEADGDVLMLGAPLETLTILHYAEELARVPTKKTVVYEAAVRTGDGVEWREIRDIDTSAGAFPYERVVESGMDGFEVIGRDALESGIGRRGSIGESLSSLLPARDLVRFASSWMERRFGANG
jgi:aminoglycoside 3-N-acetyltransferase